MVGVPVVAQQGTRSQDPWEVLNAGDPARAEALFRTAIASDPSDPVLHYGAGVASFLLGRSREATRALTRALELEPRLTEASLVLGELYYREGNVEAAARTYERALTHAPQVPEIRERLEQWRKELATHRALVTRNDGRFSIVFEGRTESALADHAIATLEAAYWRIAQALDSFPSNRVTVTLYTEQQFRELTNAPDWASALFDGRIRIPAQGALERADEFDRVLVHELTHAIVHMLAPNRVPVWLHEGLAQYFEGENADEAVGILKKTGLLPIELFVRGFSSLPANQAAVAYMQSHVIVDVIMKRVGARMGIVLQGLSRGQSIQTGLGQVGVSVADLESDLQTVFGLAPR